MPLSRISELPDPTPRHYEVFDDFIRRYNRVLHKRAWRLSDRYNESDDMYQEAVASAWRGVLVANLDAPNLPAFLLSYADGGILSFKRDHGSRLKFSRRTPWDERAEALRMASLDVAFQDTGEGDDDGHVSLYNIVATDMDVEQEVLATISEAEFQEWLRCCPGLTDRDRYVLKRRYLDDPTAGQRAIAAEIGVSQMHVSRIERKALEKLRKAFEEKHAVPS